MYSTIFKNAILNLYKNRIYTVDYAILKATDYADKGKLNAEDYEELMNYFIAEQEKAMQEEIQEEYIEEEIIEDTVVEEDVIENSTEVAEEPENTEITEN